jgi:hypothetical protein
MPPLPCHSPIFIDGRIEAKYNREKVSGATCVFVLTVGPSGFGFQLGNLPAHFCNLPLHSFLGHKSERSRCQLGEKQSAIDSKRRISNYAARRS